MKRKFCELNIGDAFQTTGGTYVKSTATLASEVIHGTFADFNHNDEVWVVPSV